MALANYRFLPWSRRGLIAEATNPDPLNAPLPAGRAAIRVALSINRGAPTQAPDICTYGPGDVTGIDTRVIVRTEPRPQTPDFEPNYLAAIDFDAPDFPWMLTPAAANVTSAVHKLRPWLVLLVFDRERIDPPRMKAGRPLPSIEISSAMAATELPDLVESWAWVHTQVSVAQGFTGSIANELATKPDLNVSRLICPRRLAPERRYLACLVPAFDQGVVRGLGGEPDVTQPLGPAWSITTPTTVELPVYFHWEFATGVGGDFEELARKLKPILPPATLGYQKIYLHPEELELAGLTPNQPANYTWIEGALQAPRPSGSPPPPAGHPGAALTTIPQQVRTRLQERLDEPALLAAGQNPGTTRAIGPPIYGGFPVNEHTVGGSTVAWLRELNIDPRTRVAAGLGAEVVRANQEDFMQSCWEQVDEVLKANELLNRARLAQELGHRVFTRFFRNLPNDQLLGMTAPMHARIRLQQNSIGVALQKSSMPDASFDPAMRRMLSPQRPWIKSAMRRGGRRAGGTNTTMPTTLNTLSPTSDPTVFVPDGIETSRGLARAVVAGSTALDFRPVGLNVSLAAPAGATLTQSVQAAASAGAQGFVPLTISPTLDQSGIIVDLHTRRALELADIALEQGKQPPAVGNLLAQMLVVAAENPTAPALMLSAEIGTPVRPVFVRTDGRVVVGAGTRAPVVAMLDPSVRPTTPSGTAVLLDRLPPGTLATQPAAAGAVPAIRPETTATELPGRGGIELPDRPTTNTTLLPIRDVLQVSRYRTAFAGYLTEVSGTKAPPTTSFVPMGFDQMRTALLTRANPLTTIPARVGTMVTVNGQPMTTAPGVIVPPTMDRVMIGPKIRAATYAHLAAYDGERFLPGIGEVPADALMLLVTNPRFVEAFLIGLNHEMNRELLWRAYPTDQRGTVFQRFWAWADGGNDINEIHTFARTSALGKIARQLASGSQIVMLVRGQLLRRYPGTVVLAWKGELRAGRLQLKANPADADVIAPVFSGRFDPDFTFFGFPLTPDDILNGQWFLVLQQQPAEPRFGFDTPESDRSPALDSWLDATWSDVGTAEGSYIRLAGNPLAGRTIGGVIFGRDAAHMATVLLQRPFRAAFDAKKLLAKLR